MAPNPFPSQRSVAPPPKRSPLIKAILLFCLSLLSLVVLGLTAYAMSIWGMYINHPGSVAGNIEQTVAQSVTLAALGGCLLDGLLIWLLARYRWMAHSTAKWMLYGVGAITALNGVLLCLPQIHG
ncbi:MAG: hypothetical protein SFY66_02830 [Oculatellaceae cyanobacterium bins.114]|nr:hypothetical protein [Oculatellaceae cyanobacterium bins.114]